MNLLSPPGSPDSPSRFALPQRLYGRDTHVATLLRHFERAAQGSRPELLLVRGYSGIGKSSVVNELRAPVSQRRGFFLSGKFDQFQRDIPYATLAQAIRGLTQQLLAGPEAELARWRERLHQAWEDQGQVLVDVVPQLQLVAGRQPPIQELPPGEAQNRFNRLFQKFLGVFATPEHPLVVFLDDLQWADLASLRLLQFLLTHADTAPVLLIGAYRDNEISPSHPLAQALAELRTAGAGVTDLPLEPLSLGQVQRLVADALPGAEASTLGPLSALVHGKTGGNPFFLLQFLWTLSQDNLLSRTPEGSWWWDAEGIRAKGYSDDVVDFMVSRLRQLPPRVQHLLMLASCVGNAFELPLLIIISGMAPREVEPALEQALREGMLMRGGPEQYRFLHDRIQQAAHALIPAQERKAVHLRIGRLQLASLSPEQLREQLFDVVGQLNAGVELIEDTQERLRASGLNAEAGLKARSATAFRSAAAYFQAAFELLPGDPWETDFARAFQLQLDRAGSEFMSGNTAETRHLVGELQPRARTHEEMAAVYRLKSDTHLAVNEIQEALSCLLEGLSRLGMPMTPQPSWDEVMAANEEVWALLGTRPIPSLIDLPPLTDSKIKAVMSMLAALFAPAYFTNTNLLMLHLCRMVSISLRHGNSEAAVHGYAWYGIILGPGFQRYQQGYDFGVLACELAERHRYFSARGKALYSLEIINYWTRPISVSLELIRSAFHHALQSGDFQIACYACNHILTNRLMLGHPLEQVHQESVARLDFVRKAGFLPIQDIVHHIQRYVQQLRGLSRAFDTLSGEDFDEEAFEAQLTPQHMSTMRCWYWIIKMQSRFMYGAYEQAREYGERAAELLWSSLSHIQLLDFHLYRALTLAACYPAAAPEARQRYLADMRRHQEQLAEWAASCAENFRAPERMVSAELARLSGRMEEAVSAYEEALRLARAHGVTQNEALANELAAGFWRERGVPTIADAYARQAREAYLRWGAHGKVRQLEARWPHLLSFSAASTALPDTRPPQQEALALVKALSAELDPERLAATLVRVATERVEASRGALLLAQADTLTVAARAEATAPGSTPPGAGDGLPWNLLASVSRTREHVLIEDTSQPHALVSDASLAPGPARAVLCLPLVRGEQLLGVLYLEAPAHAFTPAHLSLLGELALHAALSLENARRYAEALRAEAAQRRANAELAQRLEGRTWELQQAEARLAEALRTSGLSEVAASVLHNVGNVVTSAVVSLQLLRTQVDASRLGRLKQATGILQEHRGDLANFLTRSPQGLRLVDYLLELPDELLREQELLRAGLAELNESMEHLRAIRQVQPGAGRGTLLPEECDLSRLVEDALSLQMPSLQNHRISITRELSPVPRVRLDKHRVLQILINLITNARNAMVELPEGQRRLRVRLEARGSTAHIEVVDTGKGIAPEHRERLFSQGFTTREGGQGLGLHSSAQAAKTLGGRLTLRSEGPGKGAIATLELPLA